MDAESSKVFFRLAQFGPDTSGQFADDNSDGIPDVWQICHFGSLTAVNSGAYDDPDNDGVFNREEFKNGTNPNLFDTDMDGFGDGDDLKPVDHNFSIAMDSPYISEFMAKTNGTYPYPIGDTNSDWLEIYNPTNHSVDLTGWKLKNDNQIFTFPSGISMAAGSYLVVLCDHPGISPLPDVIYTDFRLEREGEHLSLLQPDDRVASRFYEKYPEQTENISFGISQNGKQMGPLETPTPGHPNSNLTSVYSFSNGTLAEHLAYSIDSRIAGKDPQVSMPLFTTRSIPLPSNPLTPPQATLNSNCWAKDIDLSCVSIGSDYAENTNQYKSDYYPVTLITKRHILGATHTTGGQNYVGRNLYFMEPNGNIISRSVVAIKMVPIIFNPYIPDITVGLLNEPVPASIQPAKIMNPTYLNYINESEKTPTIYLNQNRQCGVGEVVAKNIIQDLDLILYKSTTAERDIFLNIIISGDSSSPVFGIINSKPILIMAFKNPSFAANIIGAGSCTLHFKDALALAINELDASYILKEVNIEQFSAY